jgi:hypothetical protein
VAAQVYLLKLKLNDLMKLVLHRSCSFPGSERDSLNVVHLLLQRGALVNATDNHKKTPLHYAVSVDFFHVPCLPIVALLLEYGANVNAQDEEGVTALHIAVLPCDEDFGVRIGVMMQVSQYLIIMERLHSHWMSLTSC